MRRKIILFALMITFFIGLSFSQTIDLIVEAKRAKWFNDQRTPLPFPGAPEDSRGFARLVAARLEDGQYYAQVLHTHPRWVANGWIEGHYQLTIPENSHFESMVGFIDGAKGSDGVFFEVWWREKNKEYLLKRMEKTYSQNLGSISLDLSSYGGHSGILLLRVRAGKSSGQDWAVWTSAKILPFIGRVTPPPKVVKEPEVIKRSDKAKEALALPRVVTKPAPKEAKQLGNIFLWECPEGHIWVGQSGDCPECGNKDSGHRAFGEWFCPRCQNIWVSQSATCPKCRNVCTLDHVSLARLCSNNHKWIGYAACSQCGKPGKPQIVAFKCLECAPDWFKAKLAELQSKKKNGQLTRPEQMEQILNEPQAPKWKGANPVCQICRKNVYKRAKEGK